MGIVRHDNVSGLISTHLLICKSSVCNFPHTLKTANTNGTLHHHLESGLRLLLPHVYNWELRLSTRPLLYKILKFIIFPKAEIGLVIVFAMSLIFLPKFILMTSGNEFIIVFFRQALQIFHIAYSDAHCTFSVYH